MRHPDRVPLPVPSLMLVTEPMECSRLVDIVRAAVSGGVNVVQLRDPTLSPDERTQVASALKRCLPDTPLLVNGCPSAARRAGASGVHLPERGAGIDDARAAVGNGKLVGRSVHSMEAAVEAENEGADYLIAGMIFASRSHPERTPAGTDFLREVCAAVAAPVIAIGGMTPERVEPCLRAGAAGVAVLSAIMRSADPAAVAARYWQILEQERAASFDR